MQRMLFNSTGVVKILVDYLDRVCVEILVVWRRCLKSVLENVKLCEWMDRVLNFEGGECSLVRSRSRSTLTRRAARIGPSEPGHPHAPSLARLASNGRHRNAADPWRERGFARAGQGIRMPAR